MPLNRQQRRHQERRDHQRWLIGLLVPVGLAFLTSYAVYIVKVERLEAIVEQMVGRQDTMGELMLNLLLGDMEGRD